MKKQRSASHRSDEASITVTLGQLIACGLPSQQHPVPPLVTLERTRMPGQLSYRLLRLTRDIRKELESYEPVRLDLWKKHGTLSADGTQYVLVTPEARAAFNAEHEPVAATEITLFHKAMPEILDFAQLTPDEVLTLEWLIGDPRERLTEHILQ